MNGKLCYSTLNTLDAPCPDCGVAKVFAGKTTSHSHEYCSTTIDGKPYWVEVIASPIKDENGKIIAVSEISIDITKRKIVEQELMASDAKFKAISESAIDAIFLFDKEDRITYWNPASERIFGYSKKEAVGKKISEIIVSTQFRDSRLNLTSRSGVAENKHVMGEIQEFSAVRKDGSEFLIELSMTELQVNENRYFAAIARDVTDRKRAEEKVNQMVDQLVLVNEKLGVVGSLTRHDVRNKLSAVTGYAYLLKKRHKDLADVVDGLSRMEQAVAESVKIFDFAKMYEQLGVEDLIYTDVETKLKEAYSLFSGSLPKIINECQGLKVLADSFLRQLFYNFIDNTRKYGKKATTIRVYFENETSQDCLRLVYEDDGVGVLSENKPCLFREGYSTGDSTGFGLFLIKKMMDIYGWEIEEDGEPGKGAKFTIMIPKLNRNGKENYQIEPTLTAN